METRIIFGKEYRRIPDIDEGGFRMVDCWIGVDAKFDRDNRAVEGPLVVSDDSWPVIGVTISGEGA